MPITTWTSNHDISGGQSDISGGFCDISGGYCDISGGGYLMLFTGKCRPIVTSQAMIKTFEAGIVTNEAVMVYTYDY